MGELPNKGRRKLRCKTLVHGEVSKGGRDGESFCNIVGQGEMGETSKRWQL